MLLTCQGKQIGNRGANIRFQRFAGALRALMRKVCSDGVLKCWHMRTWLRWRNGAAVAAVALLLGGQPGRAALVPGAPAPRARLAQQRRASLPARLERAQLCRRPAWAQERGTVSLPSF